MVKWTPLTNEQIINLSEDTLRRIIENKTYAYIFNGNVYRVIKGNVCYRKL